MFSSCEDPGSHPIFSEHNWSEWYEIKQVTCIENGLIERYCSKCAETQTRNIKKDSTAHNWVPDDTVNREPTCTLNGYKGAMFCSVCDRRIPEEMIPATGHSLVEMNPQPDDEKYKPATATEDGLVAFKCETCGAIVDVTVPKITE